MSKDLSAMGSKDYGAYGSTPQPTPLCTCSNCQSLPIQSPPAGDELDGVIPHGETGRTEHTCRAHDEGMLCCTDPEHPDYQLFKQQIRSYILSEIQKVIGEDEIEYSNLDGDAGYWEKHGRNALRAEQRQALTAKFGGTKDE